MHHPLGRSSLECRFHALFADKTNSFIIHNFFVRMTDKEKDDAKTLLQRFYKPLSEDWMGAWCDVDDSVPRPHKPNAARRHLEKLPRNYLLFWISCLNDRSFDAYRSVLKSTFLHDNWQRESLGEENDRIEQKAIVQTYSEGNSASQQRKQERMGQERAYEQREQSRLQNERLAQERAHQEHLAFHTQDRARREREAIDMESQKLARQQQEEFQRRECERRQWEDENR